MTNEQMTAQAQRRVSEALRVAMDQFPPGMDVDAVLIVAWEGPGDGKPISYAVKTRAHRSMCDTVQNVALKMREKVRDFF